MSEGRDIDYIIKRYQSGATAGEIADSLGVSKNTILRDLRKTNMTLRNPGAPAIKELHSKSWLVENYIVLKRSTSDIANELGCGASLVAQWLKRHSIKARPTGSEKGRTMSAEARRKMSLAKKGKYTGSDNPNWKGSLISDDTRERRSYIAKRWREEVLERDHHTCQSCGATEHLHCHHIKEYQRYPDDRWNVNNGIVLCVTCHEKVHQRSFPDFLKPEIARRKDQPRKEPSITKLRRLDVTKEELSLLYAEHSIGQISKILGFNEETIRKKIKSFGIERRSVGGRARRIPSEEEIREVYPKLSLAEAGKHFGVGQTLMFKWLRHYSIPTSKTHRKKGNHDY